MKVLLCIDRYRKISALSRTIMESGLTHDGEGIRWSWSETLDLSGDLGSKGSHHH